MDNTLLNKNKAPTVRNGRITAIDRNRGIVVFCMLFFQVLTEFRAFGSFGYVGNHHIDQGGIQLLPGVALADLVMPMFIFSIGLTYRMNFKNRLERDGRRAAYIHFAIRYLCIAGAGTFLNGIETVGALLAGIPYVKYFKIMPILTWTMVIVLAAHLICNIKPLRPVKKYTKILITAILCTFGVITVVAGVLDEITIFTYAEDPRIYDYWITLQPIGFAGLLALATVEWKPWMRALLGFACVTGYSFIHVNTPERLDLLDRMVHGGPVAILGWLAILLFAMTVADFYHKNKNSIFIAIPITAVVGFAGYFYYDKIALLGTCSPGYVYLTLFTNVFFYSISEMFEWVIHTDNTPMIWFGKSPLLMFLLEFFVIGVPLSFWDGYVDAPLAAAIPFVIATMTIITLIAYYLNKKKIVFKL